MKNTIIDGIETHVYYRGGYKRFKPDSSIKDMRAAYAFCIYNSLPATRLFKISGGYYIMDNSGILSFFSRTLYDITYRDLFNELTHLKSPH